MTFSELKKRFYDAQSRLGDASRRFPWENSAAYLSWLAQTYEYANYSTRILALTAGSLPLSKTAHSNRFVKHAAEEKGHDRLLVNDVRALGQEMQDLLVLPEAEAFHKSLYFWIYQGKPLTIFGWVLALEGFAVTHGATIYDRTLKAHGSKACGFLRVHAQEDPEHLDKALSIIQDLNDTDLEEVGHGLELYSQLYANIFQGIIKSTCFTESKLAA